MNQLQMNIIRCFLVCLVCCKAPVYAQYIGQITSTFTDPSRNNRLVSAEVYYPSTSAGNNTPLAVGVFPLIVFGHGFVMVPSAYQNICTSLVPEGYIVVLPSTESGFSPAHAAFGQDLRFLVSEIQSNGVGALIPSSGVAPNAAIMGHSMGGGASFLAGANNNSIATLVSFAAANTNPSSILAAVQVLVPTLIFSGTNDCVAPPAQHQNLMYDSTQSIYKTQINITGGGHCYFAENNFNCSFGEGTCSPSPTISRVQQQSTVSDFLKPWLAYFLKGDCPQAQVFQDSLFQSSRISFRQSQPISCAATRLEGSVSEREFWVYPNPAHGSFTLVGYAPDLNRISIFSAEGLQVMNLNVSNATAQQTFDLSTLSPGVYVLRSMRYQQKVMILP